MHTFKFCHLQYGSCNFRVKKKKDQKIEKQLKSSVMEKHSLFQTLQES